MNRRSNYCTSLKPIFTLQTSFLNVVINFIKLNELGMQMILAKAEAMYYLQCIMHTIKKSYHENKDVCMFAKKEVIWCNKSNI